MRPHSNQRHQSRTKPSRRSLPARGYLFEEKADIHNIIDPKDMGLTVLQARRKGRLEAFKGLIPYMEAMKTKLQRMEDKREGRPDEDGKCHDLFAESRFCRKKYFSVPVSLSFLQKKRPK